MSLITIRRCDICGRRETDYGAVKDYFVEFKPGEHACGECCYIVVLAQIAKRWLDGRNGK
jgi:hypothetical protein